MWVRVGHHGRMEASVLQTRPRTNDKAAKDTSRRGGRWWWFEGKREMQITTRYGLYGPVKSGIETIFDWGVGTFSL